MDKGANSIRNEKKKRVAEVVEIPLMHEFTGIHGGGNEGESWEGTATDQSRPDPMLNRILPVESNPSGLIESFRFNLCALFPGIRHAGSAPLVKLSCLLPEIFTTGHPQGSAFQA